MLTLPQPGGGVAQYRVGKFSGELKFVALARRHDQLRAGFALVLADDQHQFQCHRGTIREYRPALEQMIAPPALQAGRERALEGRLSVRVKQVHHWLADQRALVGMSVDPEP